MLLRTVKDRCEIGSRCICTTATSCLMSSEMQEVGEVSMESAFGSSIRLSLVKQGDDQPSFTMREETIGHGGRSKRAILRID